MIAKAIVIAWIALGAILFVTNVGKPRKPTTPGVAAIGVLINAALITAIVIFWETP